MKDPVVIEAMLHDLYQDKPHQLTLLDHFAGEALNTLLVKIANNYTLSDLSSEHIKETFNKMVKISYDIAELMLKERATRLAKENN